MPEAVVRAPKPFQSRLNMSGDRFFDIFKVLLRAYSDRAFPGVGKLVGAEVAGFFSDSLPKSILLRVAGSENMHPDIC